jgi:methyltransferase (TIGR00027 family)
MARTDDDSWDITETVGATALGVAWSRALEQESDCPLFIDPYAQMFVDAAVQRGWQLPPDMAARIKSIAGYAASRTKWFDEFFIAAGANGIEQSVILASGLDARAWRLPWIDGSVVYEIDLPKVLAFKAEALRAHGATAAARCVPVPIDLRDDWPRALRDAGFDATEPTAWAAEGLLPYLPASGQDLLFERIHDLSSRGSRIGAEAFSPTAFESDYLARRQEQMYGYRRAAGIEEDVPDVTDLWYVEERTDVSVWLAGRGWEVTTVAAADLVDRYGRCVAGDSEDTTPPSIFVEGRLSG